MTRLLHLILAPLVLLAAVACDRKPVAAEAKHAHDEHQGRDDHEQERGHGGEPTHLPLKDVRGLRFLVVPEPKAEGAWYPAEAIGDESAQALLSSPVKGIVSAILTPPGRHVGPGASLLTLQSPELARLKADWLSARARRDRTVAELAREQRLFEAQAGSRRELETARSEAATARAEEEAARLALEARGQHPETAGALLTLRAPKAGAVTAYKVQLGQGVEAGQELGGFQAAAAALVRVEVPQPGPVGWKPGAETEVRHAHGRTWKARLEGTPMALTPDTRRLGFRLRLVGGPLPIPGTPVEVKVPMEKGLYLPQAALQQVDGRWGIFVVAQGTAVFRPVTRGVEIRDEVLVLSGLQPGETVVAEGAYLLKAYQQKRSAPEGEEGHGH